VTFLQTPPERTQVSCDVQDEPSGHGGVVFWYPPKMTERPVEGSEA
jgi:hypothetical protein